MNVTDALIVPKTVGFAVSLFIFFLTFFLMIAVPLIRDFITLFNEEKKKKRKRSRLFPVCLPICILSLVFVFLGSGWMGKSYDGKLLTYTISGAELMFFLFVILIGFLIYAIRGIIKDGWERSSAIILLLIVGAIVLGVVISVQNYPPLVKDIREDAYVTYSGPVKRYHGGGITNYTELLDGSGIILQSTGGVTKGTFNATIVYGEHSQRLLEIEFSD